MKPASKKIKTATRHLLVLALSIAAAACSDNGVGAASTSLATMEDEPAGENCANGGIKISTGLDSNSNGTLDASEVAATKYICNGDNGQDGSDGQNGTDGQNGADGQNGTDGQNGADGQDGTDGQDGSNGSLISVNELPPNAACIAGVLEINFGIDDNGDGILDAGEIDGTLYACSAEGLPPAQYVFVAHSDSGTTVHRYDILAGTWSSATAMPVGNAGQIAQEGDGFYYVGIDGSLQRYSATTAAYTTILPAASVANPGTRAGLQIAHNKLYRCVANTNTMNVYNFDTLAWSTIPLTTTCYGAISYDPESDRIFHKHGGFHGFGVVDPNTDTFVLDVTSPTNTGEWNRGFVAMLGRVYLIVSGGTMESRDQVTGALAAEPVGFNNSWPGSCGDYAAHIIYSAGYAGNTVFGYYDPTAQTMTYLTNHPGISAHVTCAVTH